MSPRWSTRASRAVLAALLAAVPTAALLAQNVTGRIDGTVTDARTNQPLGAVTVFIASNSIGNQTNDRGRYSLINVPAGRHEVSVRRIGYATMKKTVDVASGQTVTLDFPLTQAVVSLDEVVVTGTAVATRAKEVPTATDILNNASFKDAPVNNPQDVLTGRVPSVTVLANSGQPGAGGTIKIRGTNTVSQSTDPLIYVDGVRVFNELTRNNWGARTATSPLQDINAEDIERIEVVKGAAATTLYGTEASGGVIQIFTKQGIAGKPQWNAAVTAGQNNSLHWGDPDDPTQAFVNCGGKSNLFTLVTSGSKIGDREYFEDPTCPSDGSWTRGGQLQQYDLSLRGGSPKLTYFMSGNYGDVNGILPSQNSKDGGFRGNFAFFPIDKLQFMLNTAYTRRNTRWAGDGNNAEGFLLNVSRGSKNYMKGGKGTDCDNVDPTKVCITNAYVFDQSLTTRSDHYTTGFTTTYTANEHLTNKFSLGWDYTDIRNITNLPFGFLTLNEGYFWDELTRHTKLSLDYVGSLQNSFRMGGGFASTFSWGGQLFRDRHRWLEVDVQDFPAPVDPTLGNGAQMTYREDLPSAVTNAGFFLQEQLAWNDRLFLTGGLRVDGNSAFGENFGLQTYPKLGLAYVISDHGFWPSRFVETFKIRGAVGESGKAPGAFDQLRTWSAITGDEDKPGFTPNDIGNPDVGPERTREIEAGVDMSIGNGRLGVEATYFHAKTYDALVPVTQAPSLGFPSARITNVGSIQNTGLEMQLNAALFRSSILDWRARYNASWLRSKALDLGEQDEVYTGLGSYIKEGKAFPAYYGVRLKTPSAAATITAPEFEDNALIGLVNPNRLWGVGTTMTFFNNLTLDALVEHQGGFYVQNYTAYQSARRGAWQPCYAAQEAYVASLGGDRKVGGTGANADDASKLAGFTALERARCAFTGHNIGYWTEKGDFTKLRHVSLTYNLPARLFSASNASITLSGRNLFTWTDYHGTDPEVQDFTDQADLVGTNGQFGRRDYYQIPQARTYTVSFRVSF